jgi:hypothetical protein
VMPPARLALLLLLAAPAVARAAAPPQVHTSIYPKAVTVGQPVALTVDVFVPNYFTGAPRFPTLEVKDAVVVFQEEGGTNLSEAMGDITYAGQRRSYLIYPQREGEFEVPDFEVNVRYALEGKPSPRTGAPARGGRFTATVPAAARGLDHFLATPSLELTQVLDRGLDGLRAGDSITRTVTLTATDAFAIMLPPLDFPAPHGLAAYPAQARLSDSPGEHVSARVATRVESVTYVLEKPGHYRLPEIEVPWWDTPAHTLRRGRLAEVAFDVAANPGLKAEIPLPPDPTAAPPRPDPWEPWRRALRRHGPPALAVAIALGILLRLFRARIQALRDRYRARRRERAESPAAYLERVKQAARAGRASELLAATYRWLDRRGGSVPGAARLDRFAQASGDPALPGLAAAVIESALADPSGPTADGAAEGFVQALSRAAARPHGAGGNGNGLRPLNPRS